MGMGQTRELVNAVEDSANPNPNPGIGWLYLHTVQHN